MKFTFKFARIFRTTKRGQICQPYSPHQLLEPYSTVQALPAVSILLRSTSFKQCSKWGQSVEQWLAKVASDWLVWKSVWQIHFEANSKNDFSVKNHGLVWLVSKLISSTVLTPFPLYTNISVQGFDRPLVQASMSRICWHLQLILHLQYIHKTSIYSFTLPHGFCLQQTACSECANLSS